MTAKRARRHYNRTHGTGHASIWNAGTAINVLSIPLLTAGFYFVGNYFLTGDTLKRHDAEIAAEISAREKLSTSLLAYAQKTQEGISTLTTHAAVQDEQIKNVASTLDHVVSGLQKIETTVGPSSPLLH